MIQKSIITNGRFVTPSGVRNGELEIVDGKIASISKSIKVQKMTTYLTREINIFYPDLSKRMGIFENQGSSIRRI